MAISTLPKGISLGTRPRPHAIGGDFRALGNCQAIGGDAESGIGGDALHALGQACRGVSNCSAVVVGRRKIRTPHAPRFFGGSLHGPTRITP